MPPWRALVPRNLPCAPSPGVQLHLLCYGVLGQLTASTQQACSVSNMDTVRNISGPRAKGGQSPGEGIPAVGLLTGAVGAWLAAGASMGAAAGRCGGAPGRRCWRGACCCGCGTVSVCGIRSRRREVAASLWGLRVRGRSTAAGGNGWPRDGRATDRHDPMPFPHMFYGPLLRLKSHLEGPVSPGRLGPATKA